MCSRIYILKALNTTSTVLVLNASFLRVKMVFSEDDARIKGIKGKSEDGLDGDNGLNTGSTWFFVSHLCLRSSRSEYEKNNQNQYIIPRHPYLSAKTKWRACQAVESGGEWPHAKMRDSGAGVK